MTTVSGWTAGGLRRWRYESRRIPRPPPRVRFVKRLPILLAGAACLVAAVLAGLSLAGWRIPVTGDPARLHAPLMFGGFFGTVIALERAVGLGTAWTYAGPAFAAAGGLCLGFGGVAGWTPGLGLMLAGSLVLAAASVRVQVLSGRALHASILLLGALCLPAGHLVVLAGRPVSDAAPFWMAFLVLTIAGERLELSRVLRIAPGTRARLLCAAVLPVLGAVAGLRWFHAGEAVAGAGLLLIAVWYAATDIARINLTRPGLPRFSAVAILAGYGWLAIAGACGVLDAFVFRALLRDAFLHGAMLGFVFSMVLGHAPVIIPAVLGRPVAFSPLGWAPLGLLHLSVASRLGADVLEHSAGRMHAAALTAGALALFAIVTIRSVMAAPAA